MPPRLRPASHLRSIARPFWRSVPACVCLPLVQPALEPILQHLQPKPGQRRHGHRIRKDPTKGGVQLFVARYTVKQQGIERRAKGKQQADERSAARSQTSRKSQGAGGRSEVAGCRSTSCRLESQQVAVCRPETCRCACTSSACSQASFSATCNLPPATCTLATLPLPPAPTTATTASNRVMIPR